MKRLFCALTVAVITFSGLATAAEMAPETIPGVTTIDAKAAKALYDGGTPFVDTRGDTDWDAGRIAGAVHMDSKTITDDGLAKLVGKDQKVVFYCNGVKCLRSSEAAVKAVGWGFTGIQYLREGLPAWKTAGYPVE
jgi:rhodanese-related sulfurtransferase